MLGLVPLSVVGGLRGSRERGPGPGDVRGVRWVIVRVRRHQPLRLAHILRVSIACTGQVNALPAGVPDRQALVERVAQSRVVGLYEEVFLGEVGWGRRGSLPVPLPLVGRLWLGPLARGGGSGATVLSLHLRMAGAGFAPRLHSGASSLHWRCRAVPGRARACRV